MFYFLNELSIHQPCTDTKEQARMLMEQLTTVCIEARKMGFDQLRFAISLKGVCLSDDYYIQSWLKDEDVERGIRDALRSILNTSQTPFFEPDDVQVWEQQEKFIYNYYGNEAIGLGLAHLKETLAVSFITNHQWNTLNIILERLHVNIEPDVVTLKRHAAVLEHIESLKKTFEFNIKHGRCGKGAFPNQSTMYCCTIDEAEKLLNTALSHPKKDRWFCNYDKDNGRFVVFLPHEEQRGNKYHGFHYENTPNADPDRDLNNPQNGIPKFMQDKLRLRMS